VTKQETPTPEGAAQLARIAAQLGTLAADLTDLQARVATALGGRALSAEDVRALQGLDLATQQAENLGRAADLLAAAFPAAVPEAHLRDGLTLGDLATRIAGGSGGTGGTAAGAPGPDIAWL